MTATGPLTRLRLRWSEDAETHRSELRTLIEYLAAADCLNDDDPIDTVLEVLAKPHHWENEFQSATTWARICVMHNLDRRNRDRLARMIAGTEEE